MYYPILRWKQGEVKALENAPKGWESKVSPVWIIEEPSNIWDAVRVLSSLWAGEQMIDLSRADISEIGTTAWDQIIGCEIPFVLDPKDLAKLSSKTIDAFKVSPKFRIDLSLTETGHLNSIDPSIYATIKQFSQSRAMQIILDLGEVTDQHEKTHTKTVASSAEALNQLSEQSVILAGGCFPTNLQGVTSRTTIKRIDKAFFRAVASKLESPPLYSDYCTLSPKWDQSGIMRSSHVAIRYTHDESWLVLRTKGKDSKSIYGLTKLLALDDLFRGEYFSWADEVWSLRAEEPPAVGPGNSTFHVSEFIHHHIAQVLAFE